MCQRCDKEVLQMDIRDSDLPGLPFTLVHWYCMVDGCHCKTTVRDYGIGPLYYWPVRVTRKPNGSWRGGWGNCCHGYICSRHFREYKSDHMLFMRTHVRDYETMLARIKPITIKPKHYGYKRKTNRI